MTSTVARKLDKTEKDRLISIIGLHIDSGSHFYVKGQHDVGYDSSSPHDVYIWAGEGRYHEEFFFGEGTPEMFSAFQHLCIDVGGVYVDSSCNHVQRESTGFVTQHGEEVFVHLLLAEHGEHGYLAYADGGVLRWFGIGKKYPNYIEILREYRKQGWLITEEQWQTMARN